MTDIQLAVRRDPSAALTGVVAEIVASLPVSFRLDADDARVRVVDGSLPGWASTAHHEARAGGEVVVLDPHATDLDALEGLQSLPGHRVVLSDTWAGNPMLTAVADAWGRDLTGVALIEVSIIEPVGGVDATDLLLRAIRVLGSMGIEVSEISAPSGSSHGFTASGRTRTGGIVSVFAVHTDADRPALRVAISSATAAIQVDLPPATTARPAHARRVTTESATELPTIWQTAHRSSFQRLHRAVVAQAEIADVRDFVAALTTVAASRADAPRERHDAGRSDASRETR